MTGVVRYDIEVQILLEQPVAILDDWMHKLEDPQLLFKHLHAFLEEETLILEHLIFIGTF